MLYVDTTTIWAKPRKQRIITAGAGIVVNILIASVFTIIAATNSGLISSFGWEIVIINLMMALFSAIPFLKMDGYYILMDLVGIPKLSHSAYAELKRMLTHVEDWRSPRKLALGTFAVVSSIASVLLIAYSAWYWWRLIQLLFVAAGA